MLSTALEVLGLAVLTVTTYIGFGLVPAGYVGAACLLFVGFALSSGRPETSRPNWLAKRSPNGGWTFHRKPDDGPVLTNGKVDAEALKG